MPLGFWSFDWLFGTARTSLFGRDLYSPQDGQFMIFGKYPHSRNRNRVHSSYENSRGLPISEEEKKARIEGAARIAQSNYEQQLYEESRYKTGRRHSLTKKNKIYP